MNDALVFGYEERSDGFANVGTSMPYLYATRFTCLHCGRDLVITGQPGEGYSRPTTHLEPIQIFSPGLPSICGKCLERREPDLFARFQNQIRPGKGFVSAREVDGKIARIFVGH